MNIDYPKPSNYGYTIYTKSGCPYCDRVKYLLKDNIPQPAYIECDPFLTFNRDKFMNFIKKYTKIEYRTFPMVFLNGFFIGGYKETKEFYEEALNYR
jgi:glutaredoxin